jgi:hypothetical protein
MGIRRLSTASISTGSKSSKFWDQSTALNSYESIATVTVGAGGASSIALSSIPSTYKHLQLRFSAINSSAAQSIVIRYNTDASSSYAKHATVGYGTGTQTAGYPNGSYFNLQGYVAGSTTPFPVVGIADVLDYTNTNKYKTTRVLSGWDGNGSGGEVGLVSGLWQSTSAISTITVFLESGGTIAQYSSFALYGIKG